MKKIDFIFVGKAKAPAFQMLETLYANKIKHSTESSVIIVKDSLEKVPAQKRKKESMAILEKTKPDDFIILCDERGKTFNSIAFFKQLAAWQVRARRIVFVVGGAYGVSEELHAKSHACLRLSDFTLAHELARSVLLEQVYRALSIQAGSRYHHD